MLGLTLQDLFDQIVNDVTVIARESCYKPGGVLPPLHRERRELEPGDSALGSRLQSCHVLW